MSPVALRVRPDKVGSVCTPFGFGPYLSVQPEPVAREGAAVVCRVLTTRDVYGEMELSSGRLAKLVPGDVVVGALGNRAALRGFSGTVPRSLSNGDTIDLLNVGGVIGVSKGTMVGLGEPIRLEVLGTPLVNGKPVELADFGLPPVGRLPDPFPPTVVVAGTCMNAGKSTAAAALIRFLCEHGLRVHAGKATGVAAVRDIFAFRDRGATVALSFVDCGIPSTAYRTDVPSIARTLLGHLAVDEPDVIVLELGDGLMGSYGVDDIVCDPSLARVFTGAVLAANDTIGANAGAHMLKDAGIDVLVVTGPATDNLAGVDRLESVGWAAANIFREPERFCELVWRALPKEGA